VISRVLLLACCLLGLIPTANALDVNQEHPLAIDPSLPTALTLTLELPPEMPEERQRAFRAALETGLAAQGRLAASDVAATGTLNVIITVWMPETRAIGGRSDAISMLNAIVQLKTVPKAELKAEKHFMVSDPRILAQPDRALAQLADDIVRTQLQPVPSDALQKPEGPVVKTAKFILGAAVLVGVLAVEVMLRTPAGNP
jgi:hypothetical protein